MLFVYFGCIKCVYKILNACQTFLFKMVCLCDNSPYILIICTYVHAYFSHSIFFRIFLKFMKTQRFQIKLEFKSEKTAVENFLPLWQDLMRLDRLEIRNRLTKRDLLLIFLNLPCMIKIKYHVLQCEMWYPQLLHFFLLRPGVIYV